MLPFQTSKRLGVALAEYAKATQTPKGRPRMSAYPLRPLAGVERAQHEIGDLGDPLALEDVPCTPAARGSNVAMACIWRM